MSHFIGKGNNSIRGSDHTTVLMYRLCLYSGSDMERREFYFSDRVLSSKEIAEFEAEMLREYPQYNEAWLELNEDNPYITYVWSALDDD